MPSKDPPSEVAKIRNEISNFFRQVDEQGRRLGSASGVYAFYDYDGEPIYVGVASQIWCNSDTGRSS